MAATRWRICGYTNCTGLNEPANGSFSLAVHDTGPGIDRANQEKHFEEFQQAENPKPAKRTARGWGWGAWAQAGGLVSYGPNVGEMVRQTALYLDKILKGAKPGELPIQQPTKFELLVNLKTAKALGLTIPEAFLLRADKVIE
jgi:hypothetical protein